MRLRRELVIATLTLALFSCNTTNKERKSENPDPALARSAPSIPPNTCRIIGTIVEVDTELSTVENDPCAEVPCRALVRIDSVLAYGPGFTAPLATGKTVRIRFRFTLGPSLKSFPNVDPPLPGLRLNSRFQADVRAFEAVSVAGRNDLPYYSVERYKKIE